jgi:hypothetical protein
VWLEGLGQLKNPMASSGIKSVTFQLVASASTDFGNNKLKGSKLKYIIDMAFKSYSIISKATMIQL